jgi:hypothetical protein
MCIQYLHHIHPPMSFLHLLSLPHWYQQPQAGSVLPSCYLIFAKERKKKLHFFLFKIPTEGVLLWHFHVYMYYSLILFISSNYLLSTLVPFLWLFPPG